MHANPNKHAASAALPRPDRFLRPVSPAMYETLPVRACFNSVRSAPHVWQNFDPTMNSLPHSLQVSLCFAAGLAASVPVVGGRQNSCRTCSIVSVMLAKPFAPGIYPQTDRQMA